MILLDCVSDVCDGGYVFDVVDDNDDDDNFVVIAAGLCSWCGNGVDDDEGVVIENW